MADQMDLHMINKYILWSYPLIMSETIILVEALRVIPAEFRCYRRAWKRGRFNAAEVLFLLIKYFAITGWCLDAVIKDSDWLHSGHQCEVTHGLAYFFMYFPVTLVAFAIAWRTYIIFQCNHKVLSALVVAVLIQLALSMWTAFTQYRATVLIQGFCNPVPKKPVPNWQHSGPWFLLYNFLYDFVVSSFSTRKLIKSTGGPRGVSQISRVLFYNNVHYMVIVCSCNFAEYVAMQTSREEMPSLLPISMAIQIITAMNMLITEQDLVHGHNTVRSNALPASNTREKGGFFSSRFTNRNQSSSGWNSQTAREDTTVSKGTYGSTIKGHDDAAPFHGITYEQSKICSLEDASGRLAIPGSDTYYGRPRTNTGSTGDRSFAPIKGEDRSATTWSPAATTVVGDQTFVMATPRRPSGAANTPGSAASACTCGIGQPLVRAEAPGASPQPAQKMSIRAIREQMESSQKQSNPPAYSQGLQSHIAPSFEISRGGPSVLEYDSDMSASVTGSDMSSPASTPVRSTYPRPPNASTTSLAGHGGSMSRPGTTESTLEHIRQTATSIDATNAGRAASAAMAKLVHSRQNSATTFLSDLPHSQVHGENPRRHESNASEKEMLGTSSGSVSGASGRDANSVYSTAVSSSLPALDLSNDTQEHVSEDQVANVKPLVRRQDGSGGASGSKASSAVPRRPVPAPLDLARIH